MTNRRPAPAASESGEVSSGTEETEGASDAAESQPETESNDPSVSGSSEGTVEGGSAPEDLLGSVPEGTEVIVLDENGETVPLAAQEAEEIVLESDPMWCPAGVTPGGAGCTISYADFATLLADPIFGGGGPAQAGVIWVRDTYGGADSALITIDGSVLNVMKDYALTIKGGWTGVGGAVNTATPSVFDVGLAIINWNADVTISDIAFSGSPSGGLSVTTTKNITVTRVSATSNTGAGGTFDNTGGTGNVTISSSKFNLNTTNGLTIDSKGTITLSNIQANGNTGGYGADIANHTAAAAKNVTLSGVNEFNDNRDDGLVVSSKGAITLTDVTANGNGQADGTGSGAILNNTFGANPGPGVTLKGTNIFNNNDDMGLNVSSYGAIKINNLYANSNDDSYGAYLWNSASLTAQPLTLSGSSEFKHNGSYGLIVYSIGKVTLSKVTANSNGSYGAYIDNSSAAAPQAVVLTGANTFNGNTNSGLVILSLGAISVSSLTANDNGDYGAQLYNNISSSTGGVTVSGFGVFSGNASRGLDVASYGKVTLSKVTANSNGSYGAYIENDSAAAPQAVVLTGANTFNGNTNSGLVILSLGAISVSSLTANDNGSNGTRLYNDIIGSTGGGVTVSGFGVFSGNGLNGLDVASYGKVTLSTVTADFNGSYGAYIDNSSAAAPQAVVLTGTNTFSGNSNSGLYILSDGAITLSSVTAEGNGAGGAGDGAYINNSGGAAAKNVTLTGTNTFNANKDSGLYIESLGAISVSSLTANDNGDYGAGLYNSIGSSTGGVTVSGFGVFSGNGLSGLDVASYGKVTLSKVTANSNGSYGAYIDNSSAAAPQAVVLTGTNTFSGNSNSGLYILSDGAITLSNITANSNGNYGAYLNNSSGTGGITLSGANNFRGNIFSGLFMVSTGNISVTKSAADGNGGYGAYVNTTGSVKLTCGSYTNNASSGLYVTGGSAGVSTLTLTGLVAAGNGAPDIDTSTWVGLSPVTTRSCPLP